MKIVILAVLTSLSFSAAAKEMTFKTRKAQEFYLANLLTERGILAALDETNTRYPELLPVLEEWLPHTSYQIWTASGNHHITGTFGTTNRYICGTLLGQPVACSLVIIYNRYGMAVQAHRLVQRTNDTSNENILDVIGLEQDRALLFVTLANVKQSNVAHEMISLDGLEKR